MQWLLFKTFPKIYSIPLLGLQGRLIHHTRGFSLVELIGVLAIIAILVAVISPQVINHVGKGNVIALAQSIPVYRNAIENYYRDIGSLRPLNIAGIPTLETTGDSAVPTSLPARLVLNTSDPLNTGAAQWLRFRGPYL